MKAIWDKDAPPFYLLPNTSPDRHRDGRGRSTAVDFAAAWSLARQGSLDFHTDYLFHNPVFANAMRNGEIMLTYGIGARVPVSRELQQVKKAIVVLDLRARRDLNPRSPA